MIPDLKQEYILVDYFDTIAYRKIFSEGVKIRWAEKLSLSFDFHFSQDMIIEFRRSAERILSKNGINNQYTYRELTDFILKELKLSEGYTADGEEFYQKCLALEEKIELSVQYRNENLLDSLYELQKKGKRVFLVTDFYLGESSYRKFLRQLQIEGLFDKVFVSCDLKKSKRNGSLYRYIMDGLGISPSQMAMIGDNRISDYRIPAEMGILAIHKVNKKQEMLYKKQKWGYKNRKSITIKKLRHIFHSGKKISNYAFSFYLFIDLLYQQCIKDGVKKVYFFSREGEFLKRLFDTYNKNKERKIESEYLYVSRNSTFLPSLGNIDKEDFGILFRQYRKMSARQFMDVLGFTEKQIEEIKIQGLDDVYEDFSESGIFIQLKKDDQFIKFYDSHRKESKDSIIGYLNSVGVGQDKTYIVDIGWKGSIQDNLHKILKSKYMKGYYLGINNIGDYSSTNEKMGILFDEITHKNLTSSKIFMYENLRYEAICVASHGKTIGYSANGHTPILVEDDDVIAFREYGADVQQEIFLKFLTLCGVLGGEIVTDDEISTFELMHRKMFYQVSLNEMRIKSSMMRLHKDTFVGTSSTPDIVKENLKSLLRPYLRMKDYD